MIIDTDGLHAVANANGSRVADIVFVHGLGGQSHGTWRHGKAGTESHFFWPEALGQDLPQVGIWTMGYPAGITELGKPGMIIDKRAGNLSLKLANAGLGDRPLLFVTHSMGGLLVKALLVGSQTLADADRKRIAGMTRAVVFCATPHRGSAFASAAKVLAEFFGGAQAHVEEMRANAEPLDILHDQFIEWHRQHPIPVDSYAENIGLFRSGLLGRLIPLGLVVPRASANPGIVGHTVHDADKDHLGIVKPASRSDDVYSGVLRFVRGVLNGLDESVIARGAVPAPDSVREQGSAPVATVVQQTQPTHALEGRTAPSGVTAESPSLTLWREKLTYLEAQEAIASNPAMRFELAQQIAEARAKIQGIGGG